MLRVDLTLPQQVLHVRVHHPAEAAIVESQHPQLRHLGQRVREGLDAVAPQQHLLQLLTVGQLRRERGDVGLLEVEALELGEVADLGGQDVDLVAADVQHLEVLEAPDGRGQVGQVALGDLQLLQVLQGFHLLRKACVVLQNNRRTNVFWFCRCGPGFALTGNFRYFLPVKISIYRKQNQQSVKHTGCYFA